MAQMVKAVRMILGLESFGPTPKKALNECLDIEIEDDEPKRKPSLEEIDALEVHTLHIYLISILISPLQVLFSAVELKHMLSTSSLAIDFCA